MDYLSGINQFTQVAAQLSVLLLIVRVAFGALNCFMGYQMLKFWISVCGFFLGTGIGMTAVYILQLSGNVKWILPLAAGGITAVLGYEVYLVGAFFLGWVLTTYGILMVVRQLDIEPKMEILILAAGTLFGVLVGILVVKYARPCIIWLMAVSGGMSIATGVCGILQKDSGILMLLIMAVCVPAGVFFQFKTTHK